MKPSDDSSDSDDDEPVVTNKTTEIDTVDPKQLDWVPWFFYVAKKGYEMCDAAGEKLAWWFGITKPKYYAEIQEYEQMDEEERRAWRESFQEVVQQDELLKSIITVPPSLRNAEIFTIETQAQ